jgi:rhodanese-related sulfurtransferase
MLLLIFSGGLLVAQNGDEQYATPEGLQELIAEGEREYLLLDVRTEAEYKSGYIPTADQIHYREIRNYPNLPDEKDALIILYCQSGARSGRAHWDLERMGYTNVHNFGGIADWPGRIVRDE